MIDCRGSQISRGGAPRADDPMTPFWELFHRRREKTRGLGTASFFPRAFRSRARSSGGPKRAGTLQVPWHKFARQIECKAAIGSGDSSGESSGRSVSVR
jgi:hypothetical protein